MINRIINFYQRIFWPAEKYGRYLGVIIGNNCSISTKYFSSEPYLIKIGNHVQITKDVKFFTHSGGWIFRKNDPEFDTFGKIVVKDNVYIGNDVLILPGVIIGSNVIIGAGAVVTKSVPDNSIIAGNPGRIIGNVDALKERLEVYNVKSKSLNYKDKRELLLSLNEGMFIKK